MARKGLTFLILLTVAFSVQGYLKDQCPFYFTNEFILYTLKDTYKEPLLNQE